MKFVDDDDDDDQRKILFRQKTLNCDNKAARILAIMNNVVLVSYCIR